MLRNKELRIALLAFLGVFLGVAVVFAADGTSGAINLVNPLGTVSLPQIIGRIIKAVLGIVGSIALLMFMWGGFLWMTAAGDAKKVEKGKQTLIWATVGLAVIFFSYAATSFVINAITGGEQGGGEAPTYVASGFCLCKENPYNDYWTEFAYSSQNECEGSTEYSDCRWVFGSCKKGNQYFPTVADKEQCTSMAGYTWEGQ
jgi:hypothetical protein